MLNDNVKDIDNCIRIKCNSVRIKYNSIKVAKCRINRDKVLK